MNEKGSIVVMVLVFMGVFAILTSSLLGFIFVQKDLQEAKENREKAIQIAEAGLDYYKWFLSHYPDDLQDGTGGSGPYVHAYSDPEGGTTGDFSLEINGNQSCDTTTSIDITSTGKTQEKPNLKRKVFGRYAKPSVAEYSFVINSNVWAGADREIVGPYHSNGGIRMDGTSNSLVTSAVETWRCTGSFGCDPDEDVDGVFGSGEDPDLWEYPVPQVDFAGISQDLVAMKSKAIANGIYLRQRSGGSDQRGYRLVLKSNGTVDVYRVTRTRYALGYNTGGERRDYNTITRQRFLSNYEIPEDCGLIFVEDKVWLQGTVGAKVTIVSADVIHPNYETDLIIQGDILYTTFDGSVGLTAIAQNSVLIPLISPDHLHIRGIFVAQNGYFGRNLYFSRYAPHHKRDELDIVGTIVSNGRVGTKWSCGGSYCSGYEERTISYDRNLATNPPPFTPAISDDFRFVEWREDE